MRALNSFTGAFAKAPFKSKRAENPGVPMRKPDEVRSRVCQSIQASIAVKERLLGNAEAVSTIAAVCEVVAGALQSGCKLLLFGNGGSAADAQHIAAELVGRFAFDRPALPAMALSVNSSCVTAIGNDYGFDRVFSRQIEALGRRGDVAIGISTSGNSPNVLMGVAAARNMGLHAIGLTNQSGGKLKDEVDHCICVPSDETPRIQECHILIGHIIAEIVEQALFQQQHSCVLTGTPT
jgi:D-sedoheptulose 7-phosphate isomerase